MDFDVSPLELRRQLDPMSGAELEAFHWVIRKLTKADPDASLRALVDEGLSAGWFILGEQGELRVNPEAT